MAKSSAKPASNEAAAASQPEGVAGCQGIGKLLNEQGIKHKIAPVTDGIALTLTDKDWTTKVHGDVTVERVLQAIERCPK